MPTAVPIRSQRVAAVQRLSWPDTARFMILLLQIRWVNQRLKVEHARVERHGLDVAGPGLLYAARRWLDCHEAMNALLGTPELPEVRQGRATLHGPKLVTEETLNRVKGNQTSADCGNHCETH